MVAFGAVEIPIAVPAADQTLAILAKIDERAQKTGERMRELVPPGITPGLGRVGAAAEGLEHKIGHLGVAGSFAFTNLATGSEGGLTRVAHSLAMFGGAFGGVGLIITTFIAVTGEKLLQFWHKAQEEADKAAKSNQKFLDSVGEAKNLKAAADRQVQLFSGAQYTTEQDPLLAAGIRAGGIRTLLLKMEELKTRQAAAKKAMDEFEGGKEGSGARKLKKDYLDLTEQLKVATEQELALAAAYEKVSKLTGTLTKGAVTKESDEDRIAHQREMETANHALMQTEAKGNYDKLLAISDWWVGRMREEYGEDSKEYIEALRDQQQARNEADAAEKAENQKTRAFIHSYDEADHRVAVVSAGEHFKAQLRVATDWVERMRLMYGMNSEEYKKALAEQLTVLKDHDQKVKAEAQQLASSTAAIIGDTMHGLYSGGVAGGLRALGDSILKTLGEMLVRIGEKMLAAAAIFGPLSKWLAKPFEPGAGIGMAIGGAALIALGSAMGAAGSGGGGSHSSSGSGSGYYAANITGVMTPTYAPNTSGVRAMQPITVNAMMIGKRDPTIQRELLELITAAQGRVV